MDHLINWGREALVVVGFALAPAVAIWVALVWRRSRTVPRSMAAMSAGLDVAVVLSLVVIGVAGLRRGLGLPSGFEQWTFVPFRDLARSLDGRPWGLRPALVGVLGNVALFVPWGFFFAFRFRGESWRTLLVVTVAMAVGVEIWQAVTATGRSSDVTDVLTNTAGGLLGFAIGRLLLRLRPGPAPASSPSLPARSPDG